MIHKIRIIPKWYIRAMESHSINDVDKAKIVIGWKVISSNEKHPAFIDMRVSIKESMELPLENAFKWSSTNEDHRFWRRIECLI